MPRENVPTPSAPEMQTPHLQMSVGPTQIEQVASSHRSEYYSTPSTKVDKAVKKEADSAAAKIPVTTGPVTGASSTRIVSEDGAFMDNVKAVESAFTEETKLNFGLRINTTPIPTSPLIDRRRPGPLDLTGAKTIAATAAAAATPGPLATARIIADINTVQYPDGIRSPHPELNQHAKEGKFRYDREFLLQFMSLCKEKPAMLPPLDAIGLEPTGQHHMSRGRSGGPGRKGAPLQASANRGDRKALAVDAESPEMVDRKVKGLLKKLTMEKFDSISDQIIAWANKSEKEKDGRTLIQVIRLVFEKATDEATWSEMYARLCRKMMEQISPKVQDDGIKNNEGKLIAGGQLFRKYLLNRCQEDFERGWVAKETTAAAAAAEATDDKAVKEANDKTKEDGKEDEEEYYAAQKAKRQGLGLIKFIGELFKLQMLTERIMHECVKKLLGNVDNPEEEEIESLCMLLNTVGGILDTPKARAHLDVYFSRMKELTKSPNVNSRMQHMLLDLIELRERKWISRTSVAALSTIAHIYEADTKGYTSIGRHIRSLLPNLNTHNIRMTSAAIAQVIDESQSSHSAKLAASVVFEKGTDHLPRCAIYAKLSKSILARLVFDPEGFRKQLLDRCHQNFHENFGDTAAVTDYGSHRTSQTTFAATYTALQARRQSLGVVKFMAELYLIYTLPESTMYECASTLLKALDDPLVHRHKIEALSLLLTTVGRKLEVDYPQLHFDERFAVMTEMMSSPTSSPHIKMLSTLIELRQNGWKPRHPVSSGLPT